MPNKNNKINLSNSDIQAIICALPLVTYARTDSPEQAMINKLCCDSASRKLLNHIVPLHDNEWRVIAAAVDIALDVISGDDLSYLEGPAIDAQWRSELSKGFFTYNRLSPIFANQLGSSV